MIMQDSPFLTLMMDETTDVSNKEQVVIVMRRVSESFEVHEEFLGLYEVSSIDASTLTTVAKDVFARMNKYNKRCTIRSSFTNTS